MAKESAKAFLERLKTDQELVKKLEGVGDEEKQKIVRGMGYDFTKEEIEAAAAEMKELSDADLEAVAGGDSAVWIGVGVGVVGAGASAAA